MSLFDDPSGMSCPECGTTDPIEILYGFPSGEMFEAAEAGLIALGGCIVDPENPAYRCRNDKCNAEFGRL